MSVKQRFRLRRVWFSRQEVHTCSNTFIAQRKELREGEEVKPVKKARCQTGSNGVRSPGEAPHSFSLGRHGGTVGREKQAPMESDEPDALNFLHEGNADVI